MAAKARALIMLLPAVGSCRGALAAPFAGQRLKFVPDARNPYGLDGKWLLEDLNESAGVHSHSAGVELFDSATPVVKPALLQLPCRNTPADHERIRPFLTNSFRDAPFHERQCGRRALTCGRIVLDGVLDADVLEEACEHGGQLQHWEGLEVVQRLLEKHFKTGPLTPTGGQLDHNIRSDLPCEMHVDYLSRPPHYLLTAIVYLVDQGRECGPCETVFNDAAESGELLRGSVVQPRRGRVVLFSGGMENVHCKMPSAGKRDVVQLWFACSAAAAAAGRSDL